MNDTYNEINLFSLMCYVLKKYKKIIIATILGALLLCGYKTVTTIINNNKSNISTTDQEEYDNVIENYDYTLQQLNNSLNSYQSLIDSQVAYQENSIAYNLDATNTYVYEEFLYIDVYNTSITSMYANFIDSDINKTNIANELDIEGKYLSELYTIEWSSSVIRINVYGDSAEFCKKISDVLNANINQIHNDINRNVLSHDLVVLSTNEGFCESYYIKDIQAISKENLDSYRSMYNNAKSDYDMYVSEKQYYINNFNKEHAKTSVVSTAVKNFVLGGFAGFALMCGIYCVMYLTSDKVYDCQDLQEKINFDLLARLSKRDNEDKITQQLSKFEKRTFNSDLTDCCMLAICNAIGQGLNPNTVFVSGDVREERLQEIAEGLKIAWTNKIFYVGRDFLNDAQSVLYLNKSDYVVIVAESGVSTYSVIKKEVEKLTELDKKAGFIVIE